MNTFSLQLLSTSRQEAVQNVVSFRGEDASGAFGIMAGHARLITSLLFGLARFRNTESNWEYLAIPGGLLYFNENILTINCRRFVRGLDYTAMNAILDKELRQEEENLRVIKHSIHHMEDEVFKRLWELRNTGNAGI